ncbi:MULTISPECIES: multidrug effflux MFS transporter [unclassified Knoellia]|uniref:multidrug effflux MFS transporter n=1 Tax=Knoellia altitudinis TaxID=3404795 RepID=UPI00361D9A50
MRARPVPHSSEILAEPLGGTSAPAATTPVGRAYLRMVLVLGALVALGPLTIDTYLPALPTLAEDLGATEPQVQFTLTGIMLGLGLGQLVLGPVSDAVGRRRVMLGGIAAHAVMSVLAGLAPSIEVLTAVRIGQGISGAAVAVTAMAVVRDLFTGRRAAGLLSHLTLVIGVAPILAPSLGGLLLQLTGWRGIFGALAGIAVVLFVVALRGMDETLPVHRRRPARVGATLHTYAGLLRDRAFVGLVLLAGLMFSALFAYVAGSSFVLQEFYGLDEQQFGILFGVNAAGLIVATQVNPFLLRRWEPQHILTGGVVLGMVATSSMLVAAMVDAPLVLVLVPLWFVMFAVGLSFPNTPALALSRHGEAAGSAAALLGAIQFGMASIITPLTGLLSTGDAVGMAVVMTGAIWLGAVVLVVLVQPWKIASESEADDTLDASEVTNTADVSDVALAASR